MPFIFNARRGWCRCIKDAKKGTGYVRKRLQQALEDSIDDILRQIYAAKPNLRPNINIDTDSKAVKTTNLIDLCYNVSSTWL